MAAPQTHLETDTSGFPFEHVRKRDGGLADFDIDKIIGAIARAGEVSGEFGTDQARQLALRTLALVQVHAREAIPRVEEIQDVVEEVLLSSAYKRTAKAYILYRDQHARIRELTQQADVEIIQTYLDSADWRVRENSNMAYSLQGLNNYLAGEVCRTYWLRKIYTAEIRDAHVRGDLHIHDLSSLSVYCVGWDLEDLLMSGFRGAPGKVESKPAKHFRTALGQIVNFFYTLQGEAAGAQAFSSIDTYLAPFIRHDRLTDAEIKQALQEFVFNLNVPTRVGFQTPFTNLTMDLQPPATLASTPVVIGGERQQTTYGDYQEEMNRFNRAFLEVMVEGDARGRVFTFPIPTYNITEDFDWDAPGLERLWDVTARYGIPYFANFVNSDLSPEDARSMCCRLRLDLRELEHRGGGLFGANPLTGSIGVVTVNMPRIGHCAGDEREFLARLDRLLDIARDSLEIKRKALERLTEQRLYPYSQFYLRAIADRFGSYWNNHFSTIGLVGMHEACVNLLGRGIETEEGHALAGRVLDHMRARLQEFQQETGNQYNLEATPAEGTAYRLARLDTQRFTESQAMPALAGREGHEACYANSSQLPVDHACDVFELLESQEDLQCRYTGGTVQHVFLGEAAPDPESVKSFVRNACRRFRTPYFTVTPTFSICPVHGYLRGEVTVCPECGADTEVYSRVVGYLRPVNQWNDGKREEFARRATFELDGAR